MPKSQRAKGMSDRYWNEHRGKRPFPATVEGFLDRAGELLATTELQLDFSGKGKHPNVSGYRAGPGSYGTTIAAPAPAVGSPVSTDGKKLGNLGRLASVTRPVVAVVDEKARLRALAVEMDDIIPW